MQTVDTEANQALTDTSSDDACKRTAESFVSRLRHKIGTEKYTWVRDVFFHFCVEEYAHKILVTEQAWALFKAFFCVFKYLPDEWEAAAKEAEYEGKKSVNSIDVDGDVYGPHTMFLLKERKPNEMDGNVVCLWDFLDDALPAQEMREILTEDLGFDENRIYFWALFANVDSAKELRGEPLKVYQTTTPQGVKIIATGFSEALFLSGFGHEPYSDFCFCVGRRSDFESLLKEEDAVRLELPLVGEDVEGIVLFDDEGYRSGEKTPVVAVRIYFVGDDVIISPHVFWHPTTMDAAAYQYVKNVLALYGEHAFPGVFAERWNDASWLRLFFLYASDVIRKKAVLKVLCEHLDTDADLTVIYKTDLRRRITISRLSGGDMPAVFEVLPYLDGDNGCRVNEKHRRILQDLIEESRIRKFDETCLTFHALKMLYIKFAKYIYRHTDAPGQNESAYDPELACGISPYDFFYVLREACDGGIKAEPSILRNLLSVMVMMNDVGSASFWFGTTSAKQTRLPCIMECIYNDRMIFRDIYALWPNVWPYFQHFTVSTYETRFSQRAKFGNWLCDLWLERLDKGQITEAEYRKLLGETKLFLNDVRQKNGDFWDDAWTVRTQIPWEICHVVDEYQHNHYNPNDW